MANFFTPEGYISIQKIRNWLMNFEYENKTLSAKEVSRIIEPFWFQDYHENFLCIPETFSVLKEYISINGPNIKRNNFYSYYFDKASTDKKTRSNLEKIGVLFEKLQRNDFNDELFSSILNMYEIDNLSVNWLIDKNLILEKKSKFEWMHHTLTEFLASEYIQKSEDPINLINDLLIYHLDYDGSKNLIPSWYGVLKFLIQGKIGEQILFWLLQLLEENPKNINEDLSNLISSFPPNRLNSKIKNTTFNTIFDYYQNKRIWIPNWTRKGLANYFLDENLEKLEVSIIPTDYEVETYIHRGNTVAVVDELLQRNIINNSLLRKKWKSRLIKFALDKNTNGVLQRLSLNALSQFKESDGKLVEKLSIIYESEDSLVRDAFVEYCSESAPNSPEAIDVFIKGVLGKSRIFGRHGLYRITSEEGIKLLIRNLIENKSFLIKFIQDESIYKDSYERNDKELISRIIDLGKKDKSVESKLICLLTVAIKNENLFQINNSLYLRKIGKFIFRNQANTLILLNDVLLNKEGELKKQFFFNLIDLIPEILNIQNWQIVHDILANFEIENFEHHFDNVIFSLQFRNEPGGKQLFEKLAKLRDLKLPQLSKEKNEAKRNEEVFHEFLFKLEPQKDQFITDVFNYFLSNRKIIEKKWNINQKKRLLYLAFEDGINRIDPRKFSVNIEQKDDKRSHFKWTDQASYYGDMIKTVLVLEPSLLDLEPVKQHIIDFIPYSFSNDREVIIEIISSIEPSEISWLVNLFQNVNDDRRYLIPDSFVYFIENLFIKKQNISSAIPVLESFLFDPRISDFVQENSLRVLGKIRSKDNEYKEFLDEIFSKKDNLAIKEEANKQSIEFFEDNDSIKWRIQQIKFKIAPFTIPIGVHSIGDLEHELSSKVLISPLIRSKNIIIFPGFIDLLNEIVGKWKDEESYYNFFYYIWTSLLDHIFQFKEERFFQNLEIIQEWAKLSDIPRDKKPFIQNLIILKRTEYISKLSKEEAFL
jgi:hypothetical protein